jgi:predicted permease
MTVLGGLAWLVAKVLRLQPPLSNAFIMAIMFTNSGNFGLPLNLFAFGQEGMDTALVFFVTSALLVNSFGVYVASRGKAGAGRAMLNVLKAPMLWAALTGFLVNLLGWSVPETIDKAVQLAGQGAVPIMLLLLGMQLARTSLNENKRAIAAATVVKLAVAPLVALAITVILGMQGLSRQVGILEASMPTAVTTTILTTEYDAAPRFAASMVFVSTLLSLVSLTLLLVWLR